MRSFSRRNKELEDSRSKYADLYDFAPVGYFAFDAKGLIIEANLTGCQFLGVERANLIKKPFHTFVSKESQNQFYLHRRAVSKTAARQTCEITLITKDKSKIECQLESVPAKDADGNPTLCRTTMTDITKLKKQEELQKLNRVLKALSNSSEAMMRAEEDESQYLREVCRVIDKDCGYAMVWIGYAEDDEAKSVRPIASAGFEEGYLETLKVTWADTERGRGPTGTAIRTGKVSMCRNMLTDPAFKPWRKEALKRGYASSLAFPLFADEKVFGTLTIYSREPDPFSQDEVNLLAKLAGDLAYGITAIRSREAGALAEERLRESEERYHSLFENMLDGFAYCRMLYENGTPQDFIYLDVNKTFERLTGLKNVVGRKVSEVIPGIHESNPELFQIYGRVAQTGQPERFETYLEQLKIWFSISVYSPRKERFVAVFDDITERKRADVELKQLNEELKLSNADLEQFAYVASHDLREPLRAINGFMELLGKVYKDKLDEKALEYIKYATEGAKRMDDLLLGLLNYSRIQTQGKEFRPIPAQAALRTALTNLQKSISDNEAVITNDELPTVKADGIQLTQLLQNLITNAIKFRGKKKPEIHVGCQKKETGWQFTIRDNGIGIDPQFNERIFVIFQRLHTRDKYPGYGIGLSICKRIVERHGGRIWVESQPGKGSTFFFTIPD
jgi:PAS domain S-box-containing protein